MAGCDAGHTYDIDRKSQVLQPPMDEGRIRKIIHVDMDAFYASVEQRDDPTLRGKPLAVGYPAKRGVVVAASYEARGFGVRSAMPSTVAIRKCAELVFVPPRFDVYRGVSEQIHTIFKDYTQLVEPLSLDEAFLDVTDNLKGIPTAWETAKEIRARIYDEIGLTASAGISCNKFLAKIASDYRKPNGQFAIMPDQAEAFVASLPVAKFHGVGPKTAAKMHALGIEAGADLRGQTLAFLQDRFGKSGSWYYNIARGWDERSVQPDRERKSSGSETTFSEDLTDSVQIEAGVIAMADDVWTWCEKANARGRTVTVKIKWADFQISTRSRSMEMTIQTREKLHQVALVLVRSVFPPPKAVRLVGVTLSNFRSQAVSEKVVAGSLAPTAVGGRPLTQSSIRLSVPNPT
jgi:DNA polymerase IV